MGVMEGLSSTRNPAHVPTMEWLRPAVGESDVGDDAEAALAGHEAESLGYFSEYRIIR